MDFTVTLTPEQKARKEANERQRDKAGTEPPPRVSLIHGASIKPEPILWLWYEWLAKGKLHILAGPPGTGKTTIALALAATLTTGSKWPDGTRAKPGNILVWSGEDDPTDTLAPRLMAMGADMHRVYFVDKVEEGEEATAFDPAQHIGRLERSIADIGGIDMLIVDPIVSAVIGDSHKNSEVRRGLQPLVDLGNRMECAIIGISHFTKGTGGRDPVERVNGSIAFGALARLVFAAVKMPPHDHIGGSRLFCRSKSNLGPDDGGFRFDLLQTELESHPGVYASSLQWGEAEQGAARDLLNRAEATPKDEGDDDDEMSPPEKWLFDLLTHGPVPAKEAFADGKEAGFSEKQVRTAMTKLGVESKRHGYSKDGVWKWSLPEGTFNPKN